MQKQDKPNSKSINPKRLDIRSLKLEELKDISGGLRASFANGMLSSDDCAGAADASWMGCTG